MDPASGMGAPHEDLIRGLATGLAPVHRLPSPSRRALVWLAAVGGIALALAPFADIAALWGRITAAPDMWLAVLGSLATTVLAALAAFELSLPDARRAWALLPLPAALLWIAASGVGCLRAWVLPQTHVAAMSEARDCLMFIVGLSLPLSALLIVMLRRACTLVPGLTAAMGGLAAAAAAATLLNFFHPFDAAATDLLVHAVAVVLVVAATRLVGMRTLAGTAHEYVIRAGVTERPAGPN
jgi:hypothetical protein